MSNGAAWLGLLGFKDIPLWLSAPGADDRLRLGVAVIAIVWTCWIFWVPIKAAMGRMRRVLVQPCVPIERIEPFEPSSAAVQPAIAPIPAALPTHEYVSLRQAVEFAISKIEPAPGTYKGLGFDARKHFAIGVVIWAGEGKVTLYHTPSHGLVEHEPIPTVDLRQNPERVDVETSAVTSGTFTEYASVCIARDDLAEVVEVIRSEIAPKLD